MHFSRIAAAALALSFAAPAFADDLEIHDAYARSSGPTARTGAAFMHIMNNGDQPDRMISATSDVADRVELHTHIMTAEGVMQMREVKDGFTIPAHSMYALERGGDHVMFMGLTRKINDGDVIEVTLTFENSGPLTVEIPVDLQRMPEQKMDHGAKHDAGAGHGHD